MRHSQTIRQLDYIVGGAFLLGSLIALFAAGKILTTPHSADLAQAQALEVSAKQCLNVLEAAGIAHTAQKGVVSIAEPSTRALPSLVERASLAVQSCPGYEVTSFCAGEGCLPETGLKLELTFKER